MSYEKTTWQNGDTITAEKLNKIESGISDFIMSVEFVMEAGSAPRLNKTWKEIYDHMALGGIVIIITPVETDDEHGYVMNFIIGVTSFIDENENRVYGIYSKGLIEMHFITDNENGYPIYTVTDNSNKS